MQEGVRHWTPRPVVHRLPLEKGLSAIPRLNPSWDWWKQNTNLESHKRGTYLELWLEETKRAPLWLKTFSTFYHDYVFCFLLNVLRNYVGAGKIKKQKGQPLPHNSCSLPASYHIKNWWSVTFLLHAVNSHILNVYVYCLMWFKHCCHQIRMESLPIIPT